MAQKRIRVQKHTRNISHLVFFHGKNAYVNPPQCYLIHTLPTLLALPAGCQIPHKFSHFIFMLPYIVALY